MNNCRVSGKPLNLINDFGDQPLGNGFIENKDINKEYFYKMRTGFLNSKMFQLIEQPEPEQCSMTLCIFLKYLKLHEGTF